MHRFFRIILHLSIIAIGLYATAFSDPWDWELFRGLLLPMVAAGFFLYLLVFLLTGEYRVFRSPKARD